MSTALPADPDLGWLKKAAKHRLVALRATDPEARLHHAQLEVARDHGFPSWRALKAHVDERSIGGRLANAARDGDAATLALLLGEHHELRDLEVGRVRKPLLHVAAEHGHLACVEVLLGACADPTRRDRSDRATALHWAAAGGHVAVIERLVAAGCDPDDRADVHSAGPLGWAAVLGPCHVGAADALQGAGATLDVFAAISLGRADDLRRLVSADPARLRSTMSRFEDHRLPLHHAVRHGSAAMVQLLLDMGADPSAADSAGRTPLSCVRASTDTVIVDALIAAGADAEELALNRFSNLMTILGVSDMAAAMDHYVERLGFDVVTEWGEPPTFACVDRGGVQLFLSRTDAPTGGVRASITVDDVDALHREYLGMGTTMAVPPADQPWGMREMQVADPDNNIICFVSPIEE